MNRNREIIFVVDGHKYILTHGVKEISIRIKTNKEK